MWGIYTYTVYNVPDTATIGIWTTFWRQTLNQFSFFIPTTRDRVLNTYTIKSK